VKERELSNMLAELKPLELIVEKSPAFVVEAVSSDISLLAVVSDRDILQ
jgi:hypothetical protein